MAKHATIRAVVFDIGGVLERVDPPDAWLGKWRDRLGLTEAEFEAAAASTDRSQPAMTGGVTEAEYRQRWAEALRLSEADADEFWNDMWGLVLRRARHRADGLGRRPETGLRHGDPEQLRAWRARAGGGALRLLHGVRPDRLLARGRHGEARPADLRADLRAAQCRAAGGRVP